MNQDDPAERIRTPSPAMAIANAGVTTIAAGRPGIWRPDGLDVWTLNRTSAGCGRFVCDEGGFTTGVGDLVLIAPGVVNAYGPDEGAGWQHQWATCALDATDPDLAVLLRWPSAGRGHGLLRRHDAATDDLIDRLFSETVGVARSLVVDRHAAVSHLVRALLVLARAWREDAPRRPEPRLRTAMEYAAAHLDQDLDVATLAAQAGWSPSRFAHLFRDQVGLSPHAWIERRRIRMACDLLLMGGDPVTVIARRVGFSDPAYFARVFRRHIGCPPRTWRRSPRQEPGRGQDGS